MNRLHLLPIVILAGVELVRRSFAAGADASGGPAEDAE